MSDTARVPMALRRRSWTPEERTERGTRVSVKRACNGCGALLGDVTTAEVDAVMDGQPLPDVTAECPFCAQRAVKSHA